MTWLNPSPNLHIDLLKNQKEIGELLWSRFVADERHGDAYLITMEINEVMKILEGRG